MVEHMTRLGTLIDRVLSSRIDKNIVCILRFRLNVRTKCRATCMNSLCARRCWKDEILLRDIMIVSHEIFRKFVRT